MGMPADYIRHRENGMIEDIADIDALAASCVEVFENKSLREKIVQTGLQEVSQFTKTELAPVYQKLFIEES
jgi:glycosyltransferase involved in cell wall biosynthesis